MAYAESALVLEPRNSSRAGSWQGQKVRGKEDLEERDVSGTDSGLPSVSVTWLSAKVFLSRSLCSKGNSTLKCPWTMDNLGNYTFATVLLYELKLRSFP